MPSGYTAKIAEGMGFEEFALDCARAFGALVTMRDEPSSTPIPEKFEPSNWHLLRLEETKREIAELEAMTPQELEDNNLKDYNEKEERRLERRVELAELKAKYVAMLEQVNAWKPPTPDHEGLKKFMKKQIEESIEFDCCLEDLDKPTPKYTAEEWKAKRLKGLQWSIDYHTKEHVNEVKRTEERNGWIKALRDSLALAKH